MPQANRLKPNKAGFLPRFTPKLTGKQQYEKDPFSIYSPKRTNQYEDSHPIFAPNRSPFPFDDGSILVSPYFNKNANSPESERTFPQISEGEVIERDLFTESPTKPASTQDFIFSFFEVIAETLSSLVPAIMMKLGADSGSIERSKNIIIDLVLSKLRKLFHCLFVGQFKPFQ